MGALHRKRIADWLLTAPTEQEIEVAGWVRTKRGNKEIAFIELRQFRNDLQIVNG